MGLLYHPPLYMNTVRTEKLTAAVCRSPIPVHFGHIKEAQKQDEQMIPRLEQFCGESLVFKARIGTATPCPQNIALCLIISIFSPYPTELGLVASSTYRVLIAEHLSMVTHRSPLILKFKSHTCVPAMSFKVRACSETIEHPNFLNLSTSNERDYHPHIRSPFANGAFTHVYLVTLVD